MMPQRVQLSRRKGWRKPDGAINVARPSKWGNPFTLTNVGRRFPSLGVEQCQGFVVNEFRDLVGAWNVDATDIAAPRSLRLSMPGDLYGDPRKIVTYTYPSIAEVRACLGGHDLACWCKLGTPHGDPVPCHADVLLSLANGLTMDEVHENNRRSARQSL